MLLHRKNERRDARSKSLTLYTCPGFASWGSNSRRNRNPGETSMSLSAVPMADVKSVLPAVAGESRLKRLNVGRDSHPFARRGVARPSEYLPAQAGSSEGFRGLQIKMCLRLGVSAGGPG